MLKQLLLLIFCKMCNTNFVDINFPSNLLDPNRDFDSFQLDNLNKNIIIYLDWGEYEQHHEMIRLFHYYGRTINECGIYTYFIQCNRLDNAPNIFRIVCERHKHFGYISYNKNGDIIIHRHDHRHEYNWPKIKLTDNFNCSNETKILKENINDLQNQNEYLKKSNNYLNNSLNECVNKSNNSVLVNNYYFNNYNNYFNNYFLNNDDDIYFLLLTIWFLYILNI